jgi:hypothetical protein
MAMSSSLAGAGVAGAVVAALAAAVLGSGAGLEPALGMPARKRNINFFFQFRFRFQKTSCRAILASSLPAAMYAAPNFSFFIFFRRKGGSPRFIARTPNFLVVDK